MELKDVVKKIMGSAKLRAKLQGLSSFDEVYEFFVENGYEGGKDELKEKLFGDSGQPRALQDEDLVNVAGGISGRQVLSACAGLMMLMGATPLTNLNTYAATTSLHSAAQSSSLEELKALVDKNIDVINEKDENGYTPIIYAAWKQDWEKVKYLVEHGANATEVLPDAVGNNNMEMVKYLVEHGADVAEVVPYAVDNNNMEMVKYLVEHGADATKGLRTSANNNNMEMVKYLVENGADATKGLFGAAYNNNIEMMKYLVENGADATKGLPDAVGCNNMEMVKYLVENGADVTEGLSDAVYNNNIEIVKYLVEHGADASWGLHAALINNNTEMEQYLMDKGADINAKLYDGKTLLEVELALLEEMEKLPKEHPDDFGDDIEQLKSTIEYLRSKGAQE